MEKKRPFATETNRIQLHRIAIIVISGHVFPHDRAAAMQAGCDVFLPKPCLEGRRRVENALC